MAELHRIAYRRKLANRRLPDTCDVLRQSLSVDRGIEVPADLNNPWPVVTSNLAVRIDPLGSLRNATEGEAITAEGKFNAVFPIGTDIRNEDRIKVTSMGNRVFRIIGPRYASWASAIVMTCEEIV